MTRDEVVAAARSWKDVKWRKCGRSRAGIDCIGLIVMVAKDLGLEPADYPNYSSIPDGTKLKDMIHEQAVKINYPRPGSFGLFHLKGFPFHVGFFAEKHGKLSLIHAFAKRRKVVEEIYDPSTTHAELYAIYDLPGVE